MKISFVIPSFNCVTWLPHAVTSCLKQTHKDLEVIVVNDGSQDRTMEYLEWAQKQDPRVRVIDLKKNVGVCAARNIGNAAAAGEYIFVNDADDISTPNRVEIVLRKFAATKADYIHGAATAITCIGYPVIFFIGRDRQPTAEHIPGPWDESKPYNSIVHSTVAYTKQFAEKYPYPEQGDFSRLGLDDWAQQVVAKRGGAHFDFVQQKLCCYRITRSMATQRRSKVDVAKAKDALFASLKDKVAA